MSEAYTTQVLDHLGIVAGICQQIDLIGQIDARVPASGRKVSIGQAVQAMVINGLGLVAHSILAPNSSAINRLIYSLERVWKPMT